MRVTLLSAADEPSPRSRALLHNLVSAGHAVTASRLRRLRFGRRRVETVPFVADEREGPPEILFPATSKIVGEADRLARRVTAWVARRPDWPTPRRDLIAAAPGDPTLSVPAGEAPTEREPWETHEGPVAEDRHRGRRMVLCYRSTPASPARFFQAALERAGIEVHVTDHLDYARVGDADFVLVVESPMPPIHVEGRNPGIPVIYWAHHGEHHLEANVRLAARYGADLVLLAHSWHLAMRFDRRVERFPFGAPSGTPTRPFGERTWDLAFVGSTGGHAYARRRALLDQARAGLDRVRMESGISPQEMLALYGDSRTVLNDGGTRHLPITMRVFEALGAGAMLVTEPAPGLDLLFDGCYLPVEAPGLDVAGVRAALEDGSGEAMAAEGLRRVQAAHTYDHRVDLLLRFAASVEHRREPAQGSGGPMERFLFDHPEAQRILDAVGMVTDPGREVWSPHLLVDEPVPGTFHTVVMDRSTPATYGAAARRYVVGPRLDPDELPVVPRTVDRWGDFVVIDVGGPGYDVETVGDGEATPLG